VGVLESRNGKGKMVLEDATEILCETNPDIHEREGEASKELPER